MGLRIGVVAPPFYEVPPHGYGGTERVCAALVDGLVARGHEVVLASAGSHRTRATAHAATFASPQPEGGDEVGVEVVHVARAEAALQAHGVDVVHDHTRVGLVACEGRRAPTVATVHLPADDLYRAAAAMSPRLNLVAVSDAQRAGALELPWVATVHNGVVLDEFEYRGRDGKEGFALFLGRLSPSKGVDVAIDAARAAGVPLVIAGGPTIPSEADFVEAVVKPRLGAGVAWVGEVAGEERRSLLARAACLLFPIRWVEPFGLVMVEAMASGTPVVALRAGSVDEVVLDGVTGVVCDHPAALPAAVHAAAVLDPAACRRHVEAYFSTDAMAAGYEDVYERVLSA